MTRLTRVRRALIAAAAFLGIAAASVVTAAPAQASFPFTVTVTWVNAEGVRSPVVNAIVQVTLVNITDRDDRGGYWRGSFTANASGVATVNLPSGIQAREVRIAASAPGGQVGGVPLTTAHLGQNLSFEQSDAMIVGRTFNTAIVLHPMTTVSGTVVASDGLAVNGAASVLLWHRAIPGGTFAPVTELATDAAGRFSASGVPIGDYVVEVRSAASGRIFGRTFHPQSSTVAGATVFTTAGASTDVGDVGASPWVLPTARISGPDRYATSVAVSKVVFPDPLEYSPSIVYIVSGRSFADALSAAPLAGMQGGVLLLTAPTALPAVVEAELRRLRPENIVIAGGTGVISSAVESRLRSIGASWGLLELWRVAGANRYETSRRLVDHANTVRGAGFFGGPVFLATGTNFPDALSAAAAGGAARIPVILTGGIDESSLAPATISLLDSLQPSRLYVAGGWATVSPSAVNSYAWSRYIPVVRFAGADRYETSRLINEVFFGESDGAIVASGTQFPDALAAGPLSAALGQPLVLTPPSCVHAQLARVLARGGTDLALLVGGPGALSARVASMSTC